jgi:hypothetical protein
VRRLLLLLVALLVVPVRGDEAAPTPNLREKLRVRILETLPPVPPKGREEEVKADDEQVLELEPMIVTSAMETDLLAEARRAAEARQAAQFSLLRGGKLLSFPRGEIGFWPKLIPVKETPVKKGEVMLSVDLLRIKW